MTLDDTTRVYELHTDDVDAVLDAEFEPISEEQKQEVYSVVRSKLELNWYDEILYLIQDRCEDILTLKSEELEGE